MIASRVDYSTWVLRHPHVFLRHLALALLKPSEIAQRESAMLTCILPMNALQSVCVRARVPNGDKFLQISVAHARMHTGQRGLSYALDSQHD